MSGSMLLERLGKYTSERLLHAFYFISNVNNPTSILLIGDRLAGDDSTPVFLCTNGNSAADAEGDSILLGGVTNEEDVSNLFPSCFHVVSILTGVNADDG